MGSSLAEDGAGDVVIGGAGSDIVDYSARVLPLTVNMAFSNALANESGEGDEIGLDVEGVLTGAGDDRITGSQFADLIVSGEGADVITPGGGADIVDAGGSDDLVFARDAEADRIECGAGTDRIDADPLDVTSGCESAFGQLPRVIPPPPPPAPPPPSSPQAIASFIDGTFHAGIGKPRRLRTDRIVSRLRCPADVTGGCTYRFRVWTGRPTELQALRRRPLVGRTSRLRAGAATTARLVIAGPRLARACPARILTASIQALGRAASRGRTAIEQRGPQSRERHFRVRSGGSGQSLARVAPRDTGGREGRSTEFNDARLPTSRGRRPPLQPASPSPGVLDIPNCRSPPPHVFLRASDRLGAWRSTRPTTSASSTACPEGPCPRPPGWRAD